jgi:hypothetical protein
VKNKNRGVAEVLLLPPSKKGGHNALIQLPMNLLHEPCSMVVKGDPASVVVNVFEHSYVPYHTGTNQNAWTHHNVATSA